MSYTNRQTLLDLIAHEIEMLEAEYNHNIRLQEEANRISTQLFREEQRAKFNGLMESKLRVFCEASNLNETCTSSTLKSIFARGLKDEARRELVRDPNHPGYWYLDGHSPHTMQAHLDEQQPGQPTSKGSTVLDTLHSIQDYLTDLQANNQALSNDLMWAEQLYNWVARQGPIFNSKILFSCKLKNDQDEVACGQDQVDKIVREAGRLGTITFQPVVDPSHVDHFILSFVMDDTGLVTGVVVKPSNGQPPAVQSFTRPMALPLLEQGFPIAVQTTLQPPHSETQIVALPSAPTVVMSPAQVKHLPTASLEPAVMTTIAATQAPPVASLAQAPRPPPLPINPPHAMPPFARTNRPAAAIPIAPPLTPSNMPRFSPPPLTTTAARNPPSNSNPNISIPRPIISAPPAATSNRGPAFRTNIPQSATNAALLSSKKFQMLNQNREYGSLPNDNSQE